MARESDLSRVRQGVQLSLAAQNRLATRLDGCDDADLKAQLAVIERRKLTQSTRLLQWLGMSGQAEESAPPSPEEPEDKRGDDDASAQQPPVDPSAPATGSVTRPASSADGVAVVDRIDVTPELIRFRVPRPLDFEFTAGQSVKVGLGDIQRSYSIVSAPHEPCLEFFVELTPGGRMSEKLRHLNAGDTVTLGSPKGGLRFDAGYPAHLMIATVTGINPFISMVRDYLHRGLTGHQFHLLHGASYQAELGYMDELSSLATAYPELVRYVPTVSRPAESANDGWLGETGRVDALVDDYLEREGLDASTTLVYACGHSGMLDTVTPRCQTAGYQVRTESYD